MRNSTSVRTLMPIAWILILLLRLTVQAQEHQTNEPSSKPLEWRTSLIVEDIENPSTLVIAPGYPQILFAAERSGVIRKIENGILKRRSLLDIEELVSKKSTAGLFGFVFSPAFTVNRRLYAGYVDTQGDIVVAQFTVDEDWRASADSLRVVIKVVQNQQHRRGGAIAFDPEGFLLLAVGDGGEEGDAAAHAQNLKSPLGKILRIDVSSGKEYQIPPSNPYFNRATALSDVWASGLRDPSDIIVSKLTKEIYVVDRGASQESRVFRVQPGSNLGWPLFDGEVCRVTPCSPSSLLHNKPLMALSNTAEGCIPQGGLMKASDLSEWLMFANCKAFLAKRISSPSEESTSELPVPGEIVAVGEGEDGQVVLGTRDGKVYLLSR